MLGVLLRYKSCVMNGQLGAQPQLKKFLRNLKKVLDKRNKLC